MPINIAWGPVSIPADFTVTTPPLTLDPADTWIQPSADLSSLPDGTMCTVGIEYRTDSGSSWVGFGVWGPSPLPLKGKDGLPTQNLFRSGPFPDVGLTGRQVRAHVTLSAAGSGITGHVLTG